MKKLILSVAVLLAIVWAGTSWYVGGQTEPALQQFINGQNEQTSPMGITQEIVSYERSLFGARAITRLNLSTPPLNTFIEEVQFINNITNGPVFFGGARPVQFGMSRINTRLDMDSLDNDRRQWLDTAFEGELPFEGSALITFSGVTDYRIMINPMELSREDTTFIMEGADITGSADADMLGTYRIQTGTFEVRGDDSFFSVPPMQAGGTITAIVAGQAIGSFYISAPQVAIKTGETSETFMFDATITTSSDVKNDDVEGSFRLIADNIQGAGDVLSRLDYGGEFQGMHIAGLEAINRIRKDMADPLQQTAWDDEAMQTPEGQQKAQELLTGIGEQMVEAVFSELLQTGKSRMRLDITAESPDGKAHADIDLTYIGEGTPGMEEITGYGPEDWAAMMKGSIVITIDQAMLPQVFVLVLMPFIEQGLIVQTDDKLKSSLELAGDSVVLNGLRMRFEALLQMLTPDMGNGMFEGSGDAGPGIPDDFMQKIQEEGLTPDVMRMLEERDDIPAETLEMFRQLQQLQQDMLEGGMPERR